MKCNKSTLTIIGVAAALSMGSCNIYKKYQTPTDTPLLQEYAQVKDQPSDSTAFGNMKWENVFTDPHLVDLINRALANNKDLKNAKLNVDIAHAQLKGARLSYLPSAVFAPNGAGASYAKSALSWSYQLPLQVSWEIDIFGKLLNTKRSAQAAFYQSEAYAQAVRSQIIAGVAQTYYAIAAVKSQIELSEATSQIWRQTYEVMAEMKEAGRTTEAAVVQSRANYNSILGSLTDLRTSLAGLYNTMSLLMNSMPQEWSVPASATLAAPSFAEEGVEMSALAARPDVAAAEQSLAAAYYTTAGARAAFYPGLTITAGGGYTNLLGSMIQNPGDWFLQLAGSLTAPLFMRGQNIARLEASKAQQKQALNNFQYSLMSAAAEVSDALTAYKNNEEKAGYLALQVDDLEKASDYTNELFLYGSSTTYLEVLTAQTSLLQAQISQITCNLSRAQAIINLYQSLGGGR